MEPKEEIRKRLGRSPDKADACVLWNVVRSRPVFQKPEEPKRERNRDYGLERMLERHAGMKRIQGRYPFWS